MMIRVGLRILCGIVLVLVGAAILLAERRPKSGNTQEFDDGRWQLRAISEDVNNSSAVQEEVQATNDSLWTSASTAGAGAAISLDKGGVQKSIFSSRMRFVFLVGLEGTGHHYMSDVLQNVCSKDEVACPKTCPLGRAIYPALAKPKTAKKYQQAREDVREEMQKLANHQELLAEGKTTVASFASCQLEIGMLSYPNFNGIDKTLQYVDLRLVAEEAERAGVDLRIIYLARAAEAILISDTKHNHYGDTFMMEARILLNNAAVIESYFIEIDDAFTTCFRYENMTSEAQAERVARFLAPTEDSVSKIKQLMLAEVKPRTTKSTAKGHLTPNKGKHGHRRHLDEKSFTEAQLLVTARLQQTLDSIERRHCSG